MSSAPSSSSRTCASASSGVYFGAKRRLTVMVQRSGTTLCLPCTPPSMPHDLERLAELQPVDVDGVGLVLGETARARRTREWMALLPIHGRAACARSPSNPALATSTPWQPASTQPSVGSSSTAKSAASSSGCVARSRCRAR